MIKAFTNHTNWLNIGKTIAEKYIECLELENTGVLEYSVHPLTKSDTYIKSKGDKITEIVYRGINFKNNAETIILNKKNELFKVHDIQIVSNKIIFLVKKLLNVEFSHLLTAYEFNGISDLLEEIAIEKIWMNRGHVFKFCGTEYVFFNKFAYI